MKKCTAENYPITLLDVPRLVLCLRKAFLRVIDSLIMIEGKAGMVDNCWAWLLLRIARSIRLLFYPVHAAWPA